MGHADIRIGNRAGAVSTEPAVVATPGSIDDVIAILTDRKKYPSPVGPMGNYHSTTACATADNGALVEMTSLNRVLDISETHVRAEAGALYLDVVRELVKLGQNFYVDLNERIS